MTITRPVLADRPNNGSTASLLTGFDHLELWVGNARAVAQMLQSGCGFDCVAYSGPESGVKDRVSYLLQQGEIRYVVTAGLAQTSPITQRVLRHRDGVLTLAFSTSDVDSAFNSAVDHGAPVVTEPYEASDEVGVVRS